MLKYKKTLRKIYMKKVSIVPCPDYSDAAVTAALDAVITPLGGLDWVKKGMTVAIKANLVTFMKPEKAATTHPSLLCALTRRLVERGARVIVGDSPGGLYNAAFVGKVYSVCSVEERGFHFFKISRRGKKFCHKFSLFLLRFFERTLGKELFTGKFLAEYYLSFVSLLHFTVIF